MAARGRPADGQHRRMRGLLSTLAQRGSAGATRAPLMMSMGLDPASSSDQRVFFRDVANLKSSGWVIDCAEVGLEKRYVLTVVDHRLGAAFTTAQRAQLLRAARAAHLGQLYQDLDPSGPDGTAAPGDDGLDLAQHAIAHRCLLTFTYSARPRRVHPYDLTRRPSGWVLRARQEGTDIVKNFYLSRCTELDIDHPGTAEPPPIGLAPLNLNPMLWLEHDPIEVQVDSRVETFPDVIAVLAGHGHRRVPGAPEGWVRSAVTVTFLDAFLDGLFGLGTRVRLIGPEQVRHAARERLCMVSGVPV